MYKPLTQPIFGVSLKLFLLIRREIITKTNTNIDNIWVILYPLLPEKARFSKMDYHIHKFKIEHILYTFGFIKIKNAIIWNMYFKIMKICYQAFTLLKTTKEHVKQSKISTKKLMSSSSKKYKINSTGISQQNVTKAKYNLEKLQCITIFQNKTDHTVIYHYVSRFRISKLFHSMRCGMFWS